MGITAENPNGSCFENPGKGHCLILGGVNRNNIVDYQMSNKNNTTPEDVSAERSEQGLLTEIQISTSWEDTDISPSSTPVLYMNDNVMFPLVPAPMQMSEPSLLQLVKDASESGKAVLVVAKKPDMEDVKTSRDIYHTGVLCKVGKVIQIMESAPATVFLVPGPVAEIERVIRRAPYMIARINLKESDDTVPAESEEEMNVLMDQIRETYKSILGYLNENERNEINFALSQFNDPVRRVSFMAQNSPLDVMEKQEVLEETRLLYRATLLLHHLHQSLQKLEIKAEISMRAREDLNRQQKEMFLHQQIRNIREELGDNTDDNDIVQLQERADKKKWTKEARAHFDKELKKLERFNPGNPEYALQYAYLDTLLNLPWNDNSSDRFSLAKVESVLDRDHYGLEKVKERILEHMAVLKLRKDMKAPILCLYGPPGVGKTSLGKSIADAMGREYARVSLGGLRDEAEIRGHRRTYLGAMPGRIITALSKCGKGNPVFVLDEIDKIGADYKGDPEAALLEVLDPEQNSAFHDNYVDFDYDLSKIFFIATANSLSGLSAPLLDRMEIIEISGYITEEKIEIAKRHLVGKSLVEHGFTKLEITFSDDALRYIIERYTRESGVRQLDKKIAKVLRKVARLKASKKPYPKEVAVETVCEYLGKEEVTPDEYESNDCVGVVTGLAWTSVGGEILFIESSLSDGKGEKLTLTGNLGDVMKESAVIALQYLKAHASELGIDINAFAKKDVHVHVPEGAIPKDGPSAGITMATSLASSFTGRKVRDHIAMTGEITLRGKVLPVGGIKEKILAAKRAGITDIVLSVKNRKDIEEIEQRYLEGVTFHYVDTVGEVLDYALLPL